MRSTLTTLAATLLVAQFAVSAQPEAPQSPELFRAEQVGRALFLHDRAAWLATDALIQSTGKADPQVRGWVSLELSDAWLVRFIRTNEAVPCAAFDVTVRADRASVVALEPCQPLKGTQLARYKARDAALQKLTERCSAQYNTVVLPASLIGKSGWLVYLLAATSTPGEIVVGGHLRVLVSSSGERVVETRRLSKSCLTLQPPAKGEKYAGAVVSHVLSPFPIETHIFLSLLHGQPIYILTEKGLWRASDGHLAFMKTPEELQKAKADTTGGP